MSFATPPSRLSIQVSWLACFSRLRSKAFTTPALFFVPTSMSICATIAFVYGCHGLLFAEPPNKTSKQGDGWMCVVGEGSMYQRNTEQCRQPYSIKICRSEISTTARQKRKRLNQATDMWRIDRAEPRESILHTEQTAAKRYFWSFHCQVQPSIFSATCSFMNKR